MPNETTDQKTKRWFYYGYNHSETIDALMEKLNQKEERIAALEAELKAALEISKKVPTFMLTGSFVTGAVDKGK